VIRAWGDVFAARDPDHGAMPAKTLRDPVRTRLVVSGQLDPRTVAPFCLPAVATDPVSGVLDAWFEDAAAVQALVDRFRDLAIPLVSLHPVNAMARTR
jgi:hypothetical protein